MSRPKGFKMSEETKRKMGEAHKGRVCYWKGKKMSLEHKKKISLGLVGNQNMVGSKQSEETKIKRNIYKHGEESNAWVGDEVGYAGKHDWVRNINGKACKCENKENNALEFICKNISKTYHWALKKGREYSRNVEDYYQLCVSCHRIYDGNINK